MVDACYCDSAQPEFLSNAIRTAKKAHRCSECGCAIHPGEQYEYTAGQWEGDFSTYKTCSRCRDLREFVRAHVPCFCWCYTTVREDAIETASAYSHEAPGLLFGALRREVTIRRHAKEASNG